MQLAKKFETYAHANFSAQKRRILYIGKATRGDCQDMIYSQVHEGLQTSFWHFARRISRLADPNVENYCNLAWCNIFKQGVIRGNPGRQEAELQRAQAEDGLREDLRTLQPTLIVLVAAGYYEEIPKAAFCMESDTGPSALVETRIRFDDGRDYRFRLWSRAPYQGFPPIVWMRHPRESLDSI
ncbi:hypothetical protein [Granulicella aggregans]|uniref:hypothetical protein n=1 Tax=Granulicella aggregans TaxID=474949 RepID=UPI0021E07655|nr:hypothetical protein [Granulicella aggregans]